jgi:hypothetical protein
MMDIPNPVFLSPQLEAATEFVWEGGENPENSYASLKLELELYAKNGTVEGLEPLIRKILLFVSTGGGWLSDWNLLNELAQLPQLTDLHLKHSIVFVSQNYGGYVFLDNLPSARFNNDITEHVITHLGKFYADGMNSSVIAFTVAFVRRVIATQSWDSTLPIQWWLALHVPEELRQKVLSAL